MRMFTNPPKFIQLLLVLLMGITTLMARNSALASVEQSPVILRNVDTKANTALSIATTVVGAVVAGGDYLFWRDTRNPLPEQRSIYDYDLRNQTEFLITNTSAYRTSLASDGTLLVWIEHPAGSFTSSIQGYDLRTHQQFPILEAPAEIGFGGLAIAEGVLYYVQSAPNHGGLFAYTLTTKQEQLISINGRNPVASDGVLLWSEAVSAGSSTGSPREDWSLHLRQLAQHKITSLSMV